MAVRTELHGEKTVRLVELNEVWPTHPSPARAVRNLEPYDPVSSLDKIAQRKDLEPFKLDWNEATVPPSPHVMGAIQRFLGNTHHLNWYGDLSSKRLVRRLQDHVGVPAEHLIVTNGSDDALSLVCQTYLDADDEVVAPVPTYTHFLVFARAEGARIREVRWPSPFQRDIDTTLDCCGPRTKIIYFVSPNNPTGVLFPPDEVEHVCSVMPHAVVVVDEAYVEFCGATVIDLVTRIPNLVVTRTFSKSWGLAGLRVGYLAASAPLIENLKRVFNPKSVNVMGQVAAHAALDDLPYLENYVDEVNRSKDLLISFFGGHGIRVRTTPANYILIELDDPKGFAANLERENVYIRDRSSLPQMERYVRMSVGTVEQTRELMDRIRRVMAWH